MSTFIQKISLCIILICLHLCSHAHVTQIVVDGAITPTTVDYLDKGIETAQRTQAKALMINLNTPGGLLTATQAIVNKMLASPVPIIVYVAPQGAQAASAGTFIVYASDIAAMAPATRLGAATPVIMGGEMGESIAKKATEDTTAWIRSLAELKQRESAFAEAAVKDAKSITSKEAFEKKVVEFIAQDERDLLDQIDGFPVSINGSKKQLSLVGMPIKRLDPSLKMQILSFLSDPNIAYLLMLAGIYGLFFEMMSPGGLFPGVIGAICLTLAAYSLYILPVNVAGVTLVVLGITMLVAEIFTTTFGILTAGGIIALMLGGFFMIDKAEMNVGISLDILLGSGMAFGVIMAATIVLLARAQSSPLVNSLIGMTGKVTKTIDATSGEVLIKGERWQARATSRIEVGTAVRIDRRTDITLHVSASSEN